MKLGTYNPTTRKYEKVSVALVASTLGTDSLDVGTLCCSPRTNKHSLRKPMPLMKDNDTPLELTTDQFKNFTEGSYRKPYALAPVSATLNEYVFAGGDMNMSLDESAIKAATEWVCSRPTFVDDGTRAIKQVVNGEGLNIFARLSDFCGYDHYALPPAKVVWSDHITDNDGVKTAGVYATVTLAKREADTDDGTYGGVVMSDFIPKASTGGFSVSMLCISKDAYSIPGESAVTQRYAFGSDLMSVSMAEGDTQTIGVHSGILAALTGTFTFVIVVSTEPLVFGASSDGWTDFLKLHYYPRLANAQVSCLVAEYAVKQKAINDIKGTTIFLTDNDGVPNTLGSIYDAVGVKDPSFVEDGQTDYVEFEEDTSYGFSIKVKDQIASNIRKIAFRGYDATGGPSAKENYLNYSYANQTFYTGLKPLLSRLPMTDGSSSPYLADLFLQFKSTSDVRLIMRVSSTLSSTTKQIELGSFDCTTAAVKYITFENVTDVRGKITGSKLIVGYAAYNVDISTTNSSFYTKELAPAYTENDGPTYYPIIPTFGTSVDENGVTVISDYGDIHISLPPELSASQHHLGGYLRIDFGFYGNTPFSDLFVRGND